MDNLTESRESFDSVRWVRVKMIVTVVKAAAFIIFSCPVYELLPVAREYDPFSLHPHDHSSC